MTRLRVAVPAHLLALPAQGGHGKVWHRVLSGLAAQAELVPAPGARLRRPDVTLCSGHDDLPVARGPLVAQIHEAGWRGAELEAVVSPEFRAHIEPRTAHAARTATLVITGAQRVAEDLSAAYGIDPARLRVVPHGVDPDFRPGRPGGRELVARHAGTGPRPYVLYAASLHPRKNLPALREAVARLAAEGLPHVLAIAGGPAPDRADSSELEAAARAELPGHPGRVVRVGTPTDAELAALMAGADAFCLPSLYEGFGLTALEAMACGAPVVAADRGALPEVVGEAGLLVTPDAAGIARGLRRVLGDRAESERLRAAGPARAAAFPWSRTVAGWLGVLREAVAGQHLDSRPG
ncbi:MAG TPA: glycosyltransferase family 1 protein [Solirubrobacteraceae bacterium]|nr:glycosyltransferase family 1 protein [Solirubrobacteraceae bacterium]